MENEFPLVRAITPRPILRKRGSISHAHTQAEHIKWDEARIAEQEKERIENPKMKIDEPPTPFNYTYHADSDGDDAFPPHGTRSPDGSSETAADVRSRVVMVAALAEKLYSADTTNEEKQRSEPFEEEAPGTPPLPHIPTPEFVAKRKAVYADEGRAFRELLRKSAMVEDDDE
eukprot:TRINITY_DN2164_c0_g1_i1.p1 TRINITY_DN2164_c0_g1~~TRINITY_DN2164_c0_g1_i1.p1  ORF type:complete len:173 (+),score=29.68 TRINITY_DN2164_c0_g1_i1:69-587(+)